MNTIEKLLYSHATPAFKRFITMKKNQPKREKYEYRTPNESKKTVDN